MSRHHIITILALILILGAMGATWQFYFKEKLQAYTEAEDEMNRLEQRLTSLNQKFKGRNPEVVLAAVRGAVGPMKQAAQARSRFFTMNDMWAEEKVPEDQATMVKFYYEQQYKEKYAEVQRRAYTNTPPTLLPADFMTQFFQVPDPTQLMNMAVNKGDVEKWLTQINFGMAVIDMLTQNKAYQVTQMLVWEPREEFQVLEMRTVGLAFTMQAESLINFLETLREADRYYSVNALRIQNRVLTATYGSPYLEVEMLLTFARYLPEKSLGEAADKGQAAPTLAAAPGPQTTSFQGFRPAFATAGTTAPKRTESWWQKLWPF